MAKQTIRIVDLDSTISDDSWRHWMIDPSLHDRHPQKYYAYHMHCDGDLVINRYIVDESPHEVVFVTARHEYVRQMTKDWLDSQGFKYKALIMRADNDHTPSVELKRKVVEQLLVMFNIERAYDDRQDIVDMYHSLGINGILVR